MEIIKKSLYRILCLFCVFVISLSQLEVYAKGDIWADSFSYTLNDVILQNGVVSTESCGEYLMADCANAAYPTGVVYADLVQFTNGTEPCLVIFRSDAQNGAVTVDIYGYNQNSGKNMRLSVISKSYSLPDGHIGEFALGHNNSERYIVYNEYDCGTLINSEYYTVIGSDILTYLNPPQNTELCGVLSFTSGYLHPEVDVSYYNKYLSEFFSTLKDSVAQTVEYQNIADDITEDEEEKLSAVLRKAAGYSVFDITSYESMAEYALALKDHNCEGEFNAITHISDLGDEIYYVRYSTDISYYNGCILRRTDSLNDGYQILAVRNDFIPFSQSDIAELLDRYSNNKLLLKKSAGGMELKRNPLIKVNKINIDEKITVPQVLSPDMRKPIAFIGGGVSLALLVALWFYLSSDR